MGRDTITFTGRRTVPGTLSDYRRILDPQNWAENVPLLWNKSGLIDGELPLDRATDPELAGKEHTWTDRPFFEAITVPLVSEYRNVLQTDFSANDRRIHFAYREFECLTSRFLGQPALGGIDVDSGHAIGEQKGKGEVEIEIAKNVRFTQPSDQLDLVDAFSRVAVKMTLELLLLGLDLELPGDNDNG
jgi:hypothetical protein